MAQYARFPVLAEGDAWHGRTSTWNGVQALVDRLEAIQLPPAPDVADYYGWEPIGLTTFLEGITVAADAMPGRRFLDVGSGIGSKLAVAAALGWQVEGIERHEPYAEVSRTLFPDLPVTVGWADGFERYAEFDLVYSGRPAKSVARMDELNRLITDRMAVGALFFGAGGGPYPEWLEYVGRTVWRR